VTLSLQGQPFIQGVNGNYQPVNPRPNLSPPPSNHPLITRDGEVCSSKPRKRSKVRPSRKINHKPDYGWSDTVLTDDMYDLGTVLESRQRDLFSRMQGLNNVDDILHQPAVVLTNPSQDVDSLTLEVTVTIECDAKYRLICSRIEAVLFYNRFLQMVDTRLSSNMVAGGMREFDPEARKTAEQDLRLELANKISPTFPPSFFQYNAVHPDERNKVLERKLMCFQRWHALFRAMGWIPILFGGWFPPATLTDGSETEFVSFLAFFLSKKDWLEHQIRHWLPNGRQFLADLERNGPVTQG
jgi:hypothetical protein